MLGKTFKGLTDAMLTWQTERLKELAVDDGWVVRVRPELVVEVAFDGVQTSPRYPGGVALRFARVLRHRPDKRPERGRHARRRPGDPQKTLRKRWHARAMGEPRVEPIGAPRVLVVDDEPSITDAVATALRYEGFDAREADGGRARGARAGRVPARSRAARRDDARPRRAPGRPPAARATPTPRR